MALKFNLVSQLSTTRRTFALSQRDTQLTAALGSGGNSPVSLTDFNDLISTTLATLNAALPANSYSTGLMVESDLDTKLGSERISITQVAQRAATPYVSGFTGISVALNRTFQTGPDGALQLRQVDADSINISLLGNRSTGIVNDGKFKTGAGRDRIVVTTPVTAGGTRLAPVWMGLGSVAIKNASGATFDTGLDDDSVVADGAFRGFQNEGTVWLGQGADRIDGYASDPNIDSAGNDIPVDPEAPATIVAGIFNTGTINTFSNSNGGGTEADKDVIAGVGTGHGPFVVESYDPLAPGIYNTGTINTGWGGDVIDAISGGFAGGGTYDLATDRNGNDDEARDTVMGYGIGTFDAGLGLDNLTLAPGWYFIDYSNGGLAPASVTAPASAKILRVEDADALGAFITNGVTTGSVNGLSLDSAVSMTIKSFESIGGTDPLQGGGHFFNVLGGELKTFQITDAGELKNAIGAASFSTIIGKGTVTGQDLTTNLFGY